MIARGLVGSAIFLGLLGCGPRPLKVERCELGPAGAAALNQPLVVSLSEEVEPLSVRAPGFRVVEVESGQPARGRVECQGRRILFHPAPPLRADAADAGLRPQTRYAVELAGPPSFRCVRSRRGRLLGTAFRQEFVTVSLGDQPGDGAFLDPRPGSPPRLMAGWLTEQGHYRLRLSEPLDPRSLGAVDFRLRGPWDPPAGSSDELWNARVPKLRADLVENEVEAVIELSIVTDLPSPLSADRRHWIDFDPAALRDFGGRSLPGESLGPANPLLRWPVSQDVEPETPE